MGEKRSKLKGVVYTVQSETNRNLVHNFTERPILCEIMSKLTGDEWSKSTLDYHFTKLKEEQFTYKGYIIFLRLLTRGVSRRNKD